ncbi:MAG TPA: exodeoxyribonuclease VII small subunit [Desulfitobacteriaceae bacterium]|nr:exodeoxyribonuclease VII small subunit [Desulfitobacteriaceae bacterium]
MNNEDNSRQIPDFEAGIKRLEQIVMALEEKEISLEVSLAFFREGMELVQFCTSLLDNAERQMELLMEGPDGELRVAPASFIGEG